MNHQHTRPDAPTTPEYAKGFRDTRLIAGIELAGRLAEANAQARQRT